MTRVKHQGKKVRKQYTEEYKREGLALAERVGVAEAARQLGVHESQLYGWRAKVKREQDQGEAQRQLATESAVQYERQRLLLR
jgi:transposase